MIDEVTAARAKLVLLDHEYAVDPARWAQEQVRTKDEERKLIDVPWPTGESGEYLEDLFGVMADGEHNKLGLPKSRRMIVTWTVAAFCVHQARYYPGVAVYWQSRVEDMASFVLRERMIYIEEHLRQRQLRRDFTSNTTELRYKGTGSTITAVAQGGDALRGPTPTIVVIDECEFFEQAEESVNAALPFAKNEAKLILISSSGGPGGVLAKISKRAGFVRYAG